MSTCLHCEDPSRRVVSNSLCDRCYRRAKREGTLPPPMRRPRQPCTVSDCDREVTARGLCGMHARRQKLYGDPLKTKRNYGAKRRPSASGYWMVWAPGHPVAHALGYAPEHRMVAWDNGILTDVANHVHHIDHDKQNNDPSNLEELTPSEHAQRHLDEAGCVTNQYGTWTLRKNRQRAAA